MSQAAANLPEPPCMPGATDSPAPVMSPGAPIPPRATIPPRALVSPQALSPRGSSPRALISPRALVSPQALNSPRALAHRLISGRFNARFANLRPGATLLVGGAAEPVYLPAQGARPALIRYTRDYARSALHELAHWCLAEPQARCLEDYGLRYSPPPRCRAEQARFYAAEVPVQGLEMLLSRACGIDFKFSADNPGADGGPDREAFEGQVTAHCADLLRDGPGGDAELVLDLLNPDWRQLQEAWR